MKYNWQSFINIEDASYKMVFTMLIRLAFLFDNFPVSEMIFWFMYKVGYKQNSTPILDVFKRLNEQRR